LAIPENSDDMKKYDSHQVTWYCNWWFFDFQTYKPT